MTQVGVILDVDTYIENFIQ